MGRGTVRVKDSLRPITQTTWPRAVSALLAAIFAVLSDLIFRFSDYQALLRLLPRLGIIEFANRIIG